VARDGLYIGGREGLNARPLLIDAQGRTSAVKLPYDGSMGDVVTDPGHAGALFVFESYTHPPITYLATATKITPLGLETLPKIDYSKYVATELFATAADGVRVPMVVLTAAGPVRARPTLVDGYGAYGVSALPFFSPRPLAFVDAGGSIVQCSARGGGELGEAWRLGGKDANKPNTWRDAIACAETAIKLGYTTRDQLAITGTSAGAIFVGRAATERPDLFVAAISRVADSNALRSEIMANGPANIPEFGTVKDPQGFKNLLEMDAYQHVKDGTAYPAWLLTTGLHDSHVAPWQAGKMAARLQAAGGPAPVLLRIEEESGHGRGSTRSTRDAEEADIAAFIFWRSGLKDWQPVVKKP
jgi:prolyl oligopeptidase